MRVTSARGRFYALGALALMLGVLSFAACDQQRAVVHVQLDGLTSSVVSLSITGTLDGRSLDGASRMLAEATDSFDVKLQPDDTGVLYLEIGGIGDSGCQLGSGTSTVTITDAGRYDAAVTLSYDQANQGCQIIVTSHGRGSGTVTDDTGTLHCDLSSTSTELCASTYTAGTQVTLTAAALGGSYFAGWTGECSGTSSCTITITARPQNVSAGFLPTKLCVGSICWEHPLPQGSSLTAVFGTSSDDLWMIGEEGTLLHWNGVYTEASTVATTGILRAVWGSASAHVWSVGAGGTILSWNGASSRSC